MAYDPNSWQAQMGALGEEIVKNHFESIFFTVKKPADTFNSGASIVDFAVYLYDKLKEFVEVKVQSAFPYGIEKAPCYSFLKSKIDAYIKYSKEHNNRVSLYVVDPDSGSVYCSTLNVGLFNSEWCLMRKEKIDGREYPFEQYNKGLGGVCYYFHRNQFSGGFKISEKDCQKLLTLSQNKTTYSGEPTPEIAPALPDTAIVDEQAALELTPPQKQAKQRTDTKPDDMQKLIDKAVVTFGVPRKDFVTLIIRAREDQFNREMEPLRAMLA